MSIDDIINDSSRLVHNEVSLERFVYNDDGQEERVQPSYIVYMKYNDNYENENLYKESLKAAKEFNIPLVIIDIEKVLKSEKSKINEQIVDLNSNFNINNIINIIQEYSNNCISTNILKEKYSKLFNNYFPLKNEDNYVMDMFADKILTIANDRGKKKEFYQELFDKLMVLNEKKNIFSDLYLFKLYQKYNLDLKTNEYIDELYGITVNKSKKHGYGSFYDKIDIVEICKKYSIEVSDAILSMKLYEINDIIELCNQYNLFIDKQLIILGANHLRTNINLCKRNNIPINYETVREINLQDYIDILNTRKNNDTNQSNNSINRVVENKKNAVDFYISMLADESETRRNAEIFVGNELTEDEWENLKSNISFMYNLLNNLKIGNNKFYNFEFNELEIKLFFEVLKKIWNKNITIIEGIEQFNEAIDNEYSSNNVGNDKTRIDEEAAIFEFKTAKEAYDSISESQEIIQSIIEDNHTSLNNEHLGVTRK